MSAPVRLALSTPRVASIRGAADGSLCRHETYNGRDHLVVPVVALVGDTVIYASNAPGPELVLLSEISITPGGWNGRPVVPGHPTNATGSANEPTWLESQCFGIVFNSRIEDGRLKLDAWLDTARAAEIGDDAQDIVVRCSAGETVEISVGAYIAAEQTAGTWDATGQDYVGIWRYIVPDHLAMLPDGVIGACSVELGCGAPRVATLANVNQNQTGEIVMSTDQRSMLRRFLSALASPATSTAAETTARAAELSNIELEVRLWEALYQVVPALACVEEVKQQSKTVVYAVYSSPDTWYADRNLFQRTYKIGKDDMVTLNDDAVPVERTTTYKIVAATETPAAQSQPETPVTATAPCACQTTHASHEEGTTMPTTTPAAPLTPQQLAERLLTRPMFKGSTLAALTALGEDTLRRLNESLPDGEENPASQPVPALPATPAQPETPTTPPTVEEWFASPTVPDPIKQMARHYIAQDTQRRESLVSTLTAAQKSFTAEELQAMSTPQLEKLAGALGTATPTVPPIDFSGRAMPVTTASQVSPAPKGISLALAARNKTVTSTAN